MIYAVQTEADNASLAVLNMFNSTNGTLDAQLDTTTSKINQLYLDADNASEHIVNMFKTTNGTLLEQLSLVRGAIESIQSAADKAYKSIADMLAEQAKTNVETPKTTTGTTSTKTPLLADKVTSATNSWLPSISEIEAQKAETQKIAEIQLEADKKKEKVIKGAGSSKFSNTKMPYASGTKSATKGYHLYDEEGLGSEVILTKDGVLKQFEGGEHVFNSEQVEKLWNLSKNLQYATPNVATPDYSKFLSSVNARNQSVNVEQKFDALIKVEGDMTPDVLQQITNDRNIIKKIKDISMEGNIEAICTRGYRIN